MSDSKHFRVVEICQGCIYCIQRPIIQSAARKAHASLRANLPFLATLVLRLALFPRLLAKRGEIPDLHMQFRTLVLNFLSLPKCLDNLQSRHVTVTDYVKSVRSASSCHRFSSRDPLMSRTVSPPFNSTSLALISAGLSTVYCSRCLTFPADFHAAGRPSPEASVALLHWFVLRPVKFPVHSGSLLGSQTS